MKKLLAALTATCLLAASLAGCGSSASAGAAAGDGTVAELNVSLAHNQTSADNPYVIARDRKGTRLSSSHTSKSRMPVSA